MTPMRTYQAPALRSPAEPAPWFTGWLRALAPLAGLAVVFILFSIMRPRTFPNVENLEVMGSETAVVGTAALGMTLVIISAGIDLSVGSTIALVTVVIAMLLKQQAVHMPPLFAAIGGVGVAAVCGLIIGTLVTTLKLPPFIVTLGTLGIYRGAAEALSHQTAVYPAQTWVAELLDIPIPGHRGMLVPPGVWMMVVLALLVAGLLRFTRFGRHIFAVGSNEQTARLCGVNVTRAKILIYTLGAAFAGIAGVLQFAHGGGGDPTTANGLELNIIAAAVIGGASLSGGEGSVLGSIIGALLMTVISNGCTKIGMPAPYQKIVTGAIIILAVVIDRLKHRRKT
jgi:ribose transport system permease protein